MHQDDDLLNPSDPQETSKRATVLSGPRDTFKNQFEYTDRRSTRGAATFVTRPDDRLAIEASPDKKLESSVIIGDNSYRSGGRAMENNMGIAVASKSQRRSYMPDREIKFILSNP